MTRALRAAMAFLGASTCVLVIVVVAAGCLL
jgi:hypothetical protein